MNIFVMISVVLELVTFVQYNVFPLDAIFLLRGLIFSLILRLLENLLQIHFLLTFVFISFCQLFG